MEKTKEELDEELRREIERLKDPKTELKAERAVHKALAPKVRAHQQILLRSRERKRRSH